jgi:iron complex outermembrane receptor protein
MSKNLIIFIIGLMTSPFIVFSQNNNLFSGIVTDNEGNELIGATVYFEELGIGDDTDISGKFNLNNIPAGKHSVVVSYVGYTPLSKEIVFQQNQKKNENFVL